MIPLLFCTAAAGELVPAEWEDVKVAQEPLGFSGTGWLKTTTGCRRVEAAGEELRATLCEEHDDVTCTWSIGFGDTWGSIGMGMCERPDGSGWGTGGTVSSHDRPLRIESPDDRVVWRRVVELYAGASGLRRDIHPCRDEGAGERTCERFTGEVFVRVEPVQTARPGVGIAVVEHDEPVDCSEPCPPDPVGDEAAAASAVLKGRQFAAKAGPWVELFRSRKACEASDHPTEVEMPGDELCDDPDATPSD